MRGERSWGRYVRRLNRFLIAVEIEGREELAHLPNPGRMEELLVPGRPVLLRPVSGSDRKTRWTAVGMPLNGFLVSLDSTLPNRFLPHALRGGWVPPLRGWRILRREPPLGRGRSDFLLAKGGRRAYLEVKSVTLVEDGIALFPDAPTARGRRHLGELARAVGAGHRGIVLFVVQRPDAVAFGPNPLDHAFYRAFRGALEAGVEAYALVCSFDGERLNPVRFLGPEAIRYVDG